MRRPIAMVTATAAIALLAGCGTSYPRNEEGAFEGSVDRVREDNLRLNVGSDTINVDTWSVCGDRTSRHISVGDELQVFAERDWFGFDAWRILTADGEPACPQD